MKPAIPLLICVLITACSSQATTSSGVNEAEEKQSQSEVLLASIKQSPSSNKAFSLSEEQIDMWQHAGCGGGHR
jgi:outer membrane PBP1 activator LpoA protein